MGKMKQSYFSAGKLPGMFALILIASGLSGCGGEGNRTTGSSQLNLAITDAPVDDADQIVIRFTGLEIHSSSATNQSFVFCDNQLTATTEACNNPTVKEIDLLKLSGTNSKPLITDATIPVGNYQWIRLDLDNSNPGYIVPSAGGQHLLTIPSGAQNGLKLNHAFTASKDGMISFTVDFDLRKSVHQTGSGDYTLRPTLRLVSNSNVGSIYGTVDSALNPDTCSPAVYLYEGENITADDEGGQGANPLTSALVTLDTGTGKYVYEIGFVEAGNYSLAFTCEADQDDSLIDDNINFAVTTNVVVSVNTATENNIQ